MVLELTFLLWYMLGASILDLGTSPMNDTPENAKSAAQLLTDFMKAADGSPTSEVRKAFNAYLALRGEPPQTSDSIALPQAASTGTTGEYSDTKIGPKALKWIQKNSIDRTRLEEVFHLNGENIEVTASEVPGNGKKEMTVNSYLLSGLRGLLQFDEPRLNESETLDLCKRLTSYDKNNHTTWRKAVGNKMTGTKPDFLLTGPGEKAAAELIKQMTGA
jgi:hypothetical protein